jgi:hypothetical protein
VTLQLIFDEANHILLPKLVERHTIRLLERTLVIEPIPEPFCNESDRNNSTKVGSKVYNIFTIWRSRFLCTKR